MSRPPIRLASPYAGGPSLIGRISWQIGRMRAQPVVSRGLKSLPAAADGASMTFWAIRRRRAAASYKRQELHPGPRRFDAVRVLTPVLTVLLAVALGMALGRLV